MEGVPPRSLSDLPAPPAVEPTAPPEPPPVEPAAEEIPELLQAEDIGKDSEVWVNFGVT